MTENGAVIRAFLVENAVPEGPQLASVLRHDGDIAIVGRAATATVAIRQVADARPDVVVLDLHVDDDNGHHVIEQIMANTPTPILVLVRGTDHRHSPDVVAALVAGALDVLPASAPWTPESGAELRRVVRQIGRVRVIRHPQRKPLPVADSGRAPHANRQPVVAIAASAGGPGALATLLPDLDGLPAPVLVVQHLHPEFTGRLVEWMSRISALPVETAAHGQLARPGHVYFSPGGLHLRLGADRRLELTEQPPSTHRPSADELLFSVAANAGPVGVGVLLTGMGEDGARGLLAIRRRGGRTIAQDEASSAVFGMPQAAQRLGAVIELLSLDLVAAAVQRAVRKVAP
ncbi:chemotaxis protein CheB [Amycolatopsis sp. NPDC051128]|uniref:chemotaxis protein CheB n=1 Tax=Amycolatopsis sp. NPDC051128 TaxID=3155412 RepID=UPI00341B6C6D